MLSNKIINLIKETDNFSFVKDDGTTTIQFPNEKITGFLNEHKSYFYKMFESFNGSSYVYNTVTNSVILINNEQKAQLENP